MTTQEGNPTQRSVFKQRPGLGWDKADTQGAKLKMFTLKLMLVPVLQLHRPEGASYMLYPQRLILKGAVTLSVIQVQGASSSPVQICKMHEIAEETEYIKIQWLK